ncbi:MAG: NAD(P)H-dependent oxidoreductase [Alphaproteobacteria bacterium]|nr:NAD(P)H-dependent oxidoreductase [Alphaproteobacteria bacterium]MBO6861902.1 NAD(P)H-dependent oxidoreductase [Alphaproteobacteria bacterium]
MAGSADTILRLDCSPKGRDANSSRFADEVAAKLSVLEPGAWQVYRDLAATPPSFIDRGFTRDMNLFPAADVASVTQTLRESEKLIGEVESARRILIATPMHNYTVPAVLKAWIDQVVRVGRTFESTPVGKVGLLPDRPVHIVVSAGGRIVGDRARQPDFLTPYLTAVFATIGLRDLTFYYLEGASRDEDTRTAAFQAARAQLALLA